MPVHFPDSCNWQGWAWLEPEARNSIQAFHVNGRKLELEAREKNQSQANVLHEIMVYT